MKAIEMKAIEMLCINTNGLPDWLKNISEGEPIDILDKGTTEKYKSKWMSGTVKKLEYIIDGDDELVPHKLFIHYLGWSDVWDEWISLKGTDIKRLAPAYTNCIDWKKNIQLGDFVDVKITSDYIKNFCCKDMVCTSCNRGPHDMGCIPEVCGIGKLDILNLWRLGKIIYKNDKYIVVHCCKSHVCLNNHKYVNNESIVFSLNIDSEDFMPASTHTSKHCKNFYCKGCSLQFDNIPWKRVLQKTINNYFNDFPLTISCEKKYLETQCPVCWEDFEDDKQKMWFSCGHCICISCFDELNKRNSDLTNNFNQKKCVYCRKNIFNYDLNTSCTIIDLNKDTVLFNENKFQTFVLSEPKNDKKFLYIDYHYNNSEKGEENHIQCKYIVCIDIYNKKVLKDMDSVFKKYLITHFDTNNKTEITMQFMDHELVEQMIYV